MKRLISPRPPTDSDPVGRSEDLEKKIDELIERINWLTRALGFYCDKCDEVSGEFMRAWTCPACSGRFCADHQRGHFCKPPDPVKHKSDGDDSYKPEF